MRLKEVRPLLAGIVILYEEAEEEYEYNDIFTGDCRDVPDQLAEREIVVIEVSSQSKLLEIELKKK